MNNEKIIADLQHAATVLQELLANTTVEHLDATLQGARQDPSKKLTPAEGSFRWMQNHYTATAAEVRAAYVIAKNIEALADELTEMTQNGAYKKEGKVPETATIKKEATIND